MHHAFIKAGEHYVDARGPVINIMLYKGRVSSGTIIKETTKEEVERLSNLVEPVSVNKISKYVKSVPALDQLLRVR